MLSYVLENVSIRQWDKDTTDLLPRKCLNIKSNADFKGYWIQPKPTKHMIEQRDKSTLEVNSMVPVWITLRSNQGRAWELPAQKQNIFLAPYFLKKTWKTLKSVKRRFEPGPH